ncbi:hypothetical protein QN277_007741 [Acacia crassicarpa]|uniref:Symplekin/Pta1 N-terminal domain-containing protein n=1 Tax=Acacia crassicarpa TaxID=499986 RepID=A0AAE1M943_9FABA|nr:hypothetical protein QN277_007741 [Acacia crassicarpa]
MINCDGDGLCVLLIGELNCLTVGTKLLALKFLETLVLLFSSDISYPEKSLLEGGRKAFNVSWLEASHPVLDPVMVMLMSEASRTVGILLNLLQSAGSLPGLLDNYCCQLLSFQVLAVNNSVHYIYIRANVSVNAPTKLDAVKSATVDIGFANRGKHWINAKSQQLADMGTGSASSDDDQYGDDDDYIDVG